MFGSTFHFVRFILAALLFTGLNMKILIIFTFSVPTIYRKTKLNTLIVIQMDVITA